MVPLVVVPDVSRAITTVSNAHRCKEKDALVPATEVAVMIRDAVQVVHVSLRRT